MWVEIYSTEYYNEYCIFDTLYIFARYELFHFCNFKSSLSVKLSIDCVSLYNSNIFVKRIKGIKPTW